MIIEKNSKKHKKRMVWNENGKGLSLRKKNEKCSNGEKCSQENYSGTKFLNVIYMDVMKFVYGCGRGEISHRITQLRNVHDNGMAKPVIGVALRRALNRLELHRGQVQLRQSLHRPGVVRAAKRLPADPKHTLVHQDRGMGRRRRRQRLLVHNARALPHPLPRVGRTVRPTIARLANADSLGTVAAILAKICAGTSHYTKKHHSTQNLPTKSINQSKYQTNRKVFLFLNKKRKKNVDKKRTRDVARISGPSAFTDTCK